MAFTDKIRLLFEVDEKGATTSLGRLKAGVADADGAVGKFKAGASGVGGIIKENIGTAAVAAGTALVAFGVKAVGAFTDAAKAALDLGSATGLSTEQASRWIAIGDDMGVTAEDLTTGLARVGKELDSGKWEKYGVATRDAAGNARSTNDILLDTFDMLGKITNETERARVGNELFGRGYANLAPLIGQTRSELEANLSAVEKGQVVTDQEAKKAEKMRLAQDQLADAFGEVTLAVGKLAAEAAPALSVVAKGVTAVANAVDLLGGEGMNDRVKEFADLAEEGRKLGINQADLNEILRDYGPTTVEANAALATLIETRRAEIIETVKASEANRQLSREEIDEKAAADKAAEAHDGLSKDKRDDADATRDLANATRDANKALRELNGELSAQEAALDAADALDEYAAKMRDATLSDREKQRATIDVKQELISYLNTLGDIPPEKQTEILTLIDGGAYQLAKTQLDEIAQERVVTLSTRVIGGGTGIRQYASGTSNHPGGLARINDGGGGEIVDLPSGARVYPADLSREMADGAGGQGTTNNYFDMRGAIGLAPTADFERAVQTAMKRVNQRGGTS